MGRTTVEDYLVQVSFLQVYRDYRNVNWNVFSVGQSSFRQCQLVFLNLTFQPLIRGFQKTIFRFECKKATWPFEQMLMQRKTTIILLWWLSIVRYNSNFYLHSEMSSLLDFHRCRFRLFKRTQTLVTMYHWPCPISISVESTHLLEAITIFIQS